MAEKKTLRAMVREQRDARAEWHKNAAKMPRDEADKQIQAFKDRQAEISDRITDGAKECPDCLKDMKQLRSEWPARLQREKEIASDRSKELSRPVEPANIGKPEDHMWDARPHGIFHDGTPKAFEIGCLRHANHRVRESLPEDAVERWNNDDYDLPREPGTVVATHRDATGEVKSQRTVKVQTSK
jgi:hypothetical protein